MRKSTRTLAKSYNERSQPKNGIPYSYEKIEFLLVRHGETQANTDAKLYSLIADHAISLSSRGKIQASQAGDRIFQYFVDKYGPEIPDNWHCRIWTSPYKMTRETAECLQNASKGWITDIKENVCLVEQQFGLFEGENWAKGDLYKNYPKELDHYYKCAAFGGRFYARVPMGESRFDVCQRVYATLPLIFAEQKLHKISHVIIVSHSVPLRAWLMMYLGRKPEWFEESKNPAHASVKLVVDAKDERYIWPEEIENQEHPDEEEDSIMFKNVPATTTPVSTSLNTDPPVPVPIWGGLPGKSSAEETVHANKT